MKRAFLLAETALSFALIGLALVFVLNLFPGARVAQRGAEERLKAGSLARTLLEERMDVPFRNLPVGLNQSLAPLTLDGVSYQPRLEVLSTPQANPGLLRILRVEVRWSTRGVSHSIRRELWRHRLPYRA